MACPPQLTKILKVADKLLLECKYESAMSHYLLILQTLKIYPIYVDEIEELEELFPNLNKSDVDNVRIMAMKSMAYIYFDTDQWSECMDFCEIILKQIPNDKEIKDLQLKLDEKQCNRLNINILSKNIEFKSSQLFKLCIIPFKGYGLMATQNISAYTLIFEEKAIFEVWSDDIWNNKKCIFDKFKTLKLNEQQIINNLSHSILFDKNEINKDKLIDIVERNNIELIWDKLSGLFPNIARINHCCKPNIIWIGDRYIKKLKIVSISNIKKGEELVAMYCHHGYPRDLRRKYLMQKFGFYCQCKRCNLLNKNEIEWDYKINKMYNKFMFKINKYLKERNIDKLKKWKQFIAECFPDKLYFVDFIMENIINNTQLIDINSIKFKKSLTHYLINKITH